MNWPLVSRGQFQIHVHTPIHLSPKGRDQLIRQRQTAHSRPGFWFGPHLIPLIPTSWCYADPSTHGNKTVFQLFTACQRNTAKYLKDAVSPQCGTTGTNCKPVRSLMKEWIKTLCGLKIFIICKTALVPYSNAVRSLGQEASLECWSPKHFAEDWL